MQENDVWMLGRALEQIITDTRYPDGSEMHQLAQRIKSLEVTTVEAVLEDPWLAAHTPADLDELRMATLYLFTPQPDSMALPSAAAASGSRRGLPPTAAAAPVAVAEQFEADLCFVDTGRERWRVFRVEAAVAQETGLAVGDIITEVDGASPKRDFWQQRAGEFYSEMRLAVEGKGLIAVRRTRAVRPEEAEQAVPDWERFRQHLFASPRPWPADGTFSRQQLLSDFIRSGYFIPVCPEKRTRVSTPTLLPHTSSVFKDSYVVVRALNQF